MPTKNPVVYHNAPAQCQICGRPFGKVMFDARIPRHGSWGNIDQECFEEYGCSLGLGRGQEYRRESTTQPWIKVAG